MLILKKRMVNSMKQSINEFIIDNSILKKYCGDSKIVLIPNGVTCIDNLAFENCTSIEKVIIPSGVTTIGYRVFENCCNLKEVEIPDTVISIDQNAFTDTPWINSFEKEVVVGDGVLLTCNGNDTHVEIPFGVKKIAPGAFFYKEHIKSVSIPNGVTEIGDDAFFLCINLGNIEIPDSVISIGKSAFLECESLKRIALPRYFKIDVEFLEIANMLELGIYQKE